MRDHDACEVAVLTRFSRMRMIAPLVLICSERELEDSSALGALADLLLVVRLGFDDDEEIGRAVGSWWRQQLGNAFMAAMRADAPLARRAIRAIFESERVPCDIGALARKVGCSREHLSRQLERSVPGGFLGESDAGCCHHDGVVFAEGCWPRLAGDCATLSCDQAHIATHVAEN